MSNRPLYYVVTIHNDGRRTKFGPFERAEARKQLAAHKDQMREKGARIGLVQVNR